MLYELILKKVLYELRKVLYELRIIKKTIDYHTDIPTSDLEPEKILNLVAQIRQVYVWT